MVQDITAVNSFMSAMKASGNSTESLLENCDYIENSTVPNQPAGVFWAVVNRLFIIFQVIVLVLSEFCWPATFFDRFFPVLGPSFGLGPLGIFQGLIGATILSHHVDDFTLVAAFFLFSIGCLNILLGLIFRDSARSKRSITEWRSEKKGVLPSSNDGRPTISRISNSYLSSGNEKGISDFGVNRITSNSSDVGMGHGFGRHGEKAAGLKGFYLTKPVETLPRYAPSATPRSRPGSGSSMYTDSQASPAVQSPPEFKSSAHAI